MTPKEKALSVLESVYVLFKHNYEVAINSYGRSGYEKDKREFEAAIAWVKAQREESC